jgi:hypothetical protein
MFRMPFFAVRPTVPGQGHWTAERAAMCCARTAVAAQRQAYHTSVAAKLAIQAPPANLMPTSVRRTRASTGVCVLILHVAQQLQPMPIRARACQAMLAPIVQCALTFATATRVPTVPLVLPA